MTSQYHMNTYAKFTESLVQPASTLRRNQSEQALSTVTSSSNISVSENISKIIVESTRKSFIAMHMPRGQLERVGARGKQIDEDAIRLKISPLSNQKKFIVKQGQLKLASNSTYCLCFNNPTVRRCILNRNVLALWHRSQGTIFLNFDTIDVELNRTGNDSFEIYVPERAETSLHLTAPSETDALEWFRALRAVIQSSYGYKYQLNKVLEIPEYQNVEFVIEEQFARECNSGDLLLFKATHTMARMQRAITFSDYDHVAIVLKNKKDQVIIFESNSSEGVAFTFWRQLVRYKWYNHVEKIAWRRLKLDRTPQDIRIMEEFIMSNLNKSFDINWQKIWKRTSALVKTPEEEKERTFFCSELVAAMYKKLGLLEKQKACTQYWPVSFSDARNLQLLKGRLQHERVIVFEDKIINDNYKR